MQNLVKLVTTLPKEWGLNYIGHVKPISNGYILVAIDYAMKGVEV
jgi:hypothetical protein